MTQDTAQTPKLHDVTVRVGSQVFGATVMPAVATMAVAGVRAKISVVSMPAVTSMSVSGLRAKVGSVSMLVRAVMSQPTGFLFRWSKASEQAVSWVPAGSEDTLWHQIHPPSTLW